MSKFELKINNISNSRPANVPLGVDGSPARGNKLIVRNLPWNLTGEELAIFISRFGIFEHVDLMCHPDTLLSKGWGVATFPDVATARHVAQTINGYMIDDRKIQAYVETDQDPRVAHSGPGINAPGINVFVSNLAWNVTTQHLHTLAAQYGEIVAMEIKTHAETGKSKGWGLIVYREREAADACIRSLNEMELMGRKLYLRLDRVQVPDIGSDCNIYVGNLSFDINSDILLSYFAEFQPIQADIAKTSFGNHRGFGIVKFATPQQAAIAIAARHHTGLCGRRIECRVDVGTNKPTSKSLYVGNIGYRKTDNELRQLFEQIGPVLTAQVQRRANGQSKQWGRVSFVNPEHNEVAVQALNGIIDHTSGNKLMVTINRK